MCLGGRLIGLEARQKRPEAGPYIGEVGKVLGDRVGEHERRQFEPGAQVGAEHARDRLVEGRRVPPSVHEGFPESDRAAGERALVKARIAHGDVPRSRPVDPDVGMGEQIGDQRRVAGGHRQGPMPAPAPGSAWRLRWPRNDGGGSAGRCCRTRARAAPDIPRCRPHARSPRARR